MSELPNCHTSRNQSNDDIDLLHRYLQHGDQQAFAEIVDRYQALVMSVCRRTVASRSDADDAFQATFLAVIRRPRSLRRCRSLSGWLYTVAFRISLRLARIRRRRRTVVLPDDLPAAERDLLSGLADAADITAVDEELNRMPERYRDVLLMTFFAGQTSQQIADQLSESKGAIDGRIRRARQLLRVRLARRGVGFGAVPVAAALTTRHAAAAPPELIRATLRLAEPQDGDPVSPANELARLNTLIPLESQLMNARILAVALTCLTFVAGTAGWKLGLPAITQASEDAASANAAFALSAPLPENAVPGGTNADQTTTNPAELPAGLAGATENVVFNGHQGTTAAQVDATPSQYAEFTSEQSRSAEARILRRLNGTAPRLDFPGEASLSEVLDLLSEHLQIRFVADYPELAMENTLTLEDVTVRNIVLEEVSVRSALDLILSQTREPQLDYVIWNEVVLITTRQAAESSEYRMLRCYDVEELMGFASKYSRLIATESRVFGPQPEVEGSGNAGQGFFSIDSTSSAETRSGAEYSEDSSQPEAHLPAEILLSLIRSMGPDLPSARDTPNPMAIIGPVLLVRGSRREHEQIVEVLESLEASARRTNGRH